MKDDWAGLTTAVLIGQQADTLVTTRVKTVQVTVEGFTGDKHAGLTHPADSRTQFYPRGTQIFNDRQVSIVSAEELTGVAASLGLPEILPEWLGANLLLSGIPNLTRLAPGTRLFFSSGAVLYVTHSNNPCSGPGKIIQSQFPDREGLTAAFVKQAMHRRGLVAVVDLPGQIIEGDAVTVNWEDRYRYRE
jgi:hypothetical protein